jgi:hypothetical protein
MISSKTVTLREAKEFGEPERNPTCPKTHTSAPE